MIQYKNIPVLSLVLLHLSSCAAGQSIPEQFDALGTRPRSIPYTNPLPLNEEGGHLQGVQFYLSGEDSFVLSGSSSTHAYYLLVGDKQVTRIVELGQNPLKHAGGFQISDSYLAVGVEDNEDKDKSEVLIYKIEELEIQQNPTWTIRREGEVMRATAGSVGIVRRQDELLIVVGDWDVRNLDFYRIDLKAPVSSSITPFTTLVTRDLEREDWVDDFWYSYQNINWIRDVDGKLYLVGLGTDEKGKNVGDLYEVNLEDGGCNLRKISSKRFSSDPSVSFKAGAGVHQGRDGKLRIVSCSSHINQAAILQVWD